MTPTDLERRFSAAMGRLSQIVHRELLRTALDAEGKAKELARQRMTARSGRLLRSIAGRVVNADPAEIHLTAGGGASDLRYAAIQEYGGVVRPVRRKWLAIPVGAALTGAGVARHATPRELNLRFVEIDGARALLVRDNPGSRRKGAHSEILFILRRRTELRPKRYMRDAFDAATGGLTDRLGASVAALFGGRGGQ